MMWKRIYSHKIYELAHDGEGHGKDEKKEKNIYKMLIWL